MESVNLYLPHLHSEAAVGDDGHLATVEVLDIEKVVHESMGMSADHEVKIPGLRDYFLVHGIAGV